MLNIKDIVTQNQFNETCEKIDDVIDETRKDINLLKTKQIEDSDSIMRVSEEIDTKVDKLSKEISNKINVQENHFTERLLSLETFTNDKLTSYINVFNTKTNNMEQKVNETMENTKKALYKDLDDVRNTITNSSEQLEEQQKSINIRIDNIENDTKNNYATKDFVIEQIRNIDIPKSREIVTDRTMIEEKYLSKIMNDVKNTPETPGIFCEYNTVNKCDDGLSLTLRTATILTKKVAGIMINDKEFVDSGYVWVSLYNKDVKYYDCLMFLYLDYTKIRLKIQAD
jgi:hypothetical protein